MLVFLSLILLSGCLLVFAVTTWNVLCWPRVSRKDSLDVTESVSILIPARNEELNLPRCLDRALAQGPVVKEVLVYDDFSSDNTAAIIRSYGASDSRVRLVAPAALPPGWIGKSFACAQLASQASSRWLLFLDADAGLTSFSVRRVVVEALSRKASLISCWPRLELKSFWESVLMPLLNFVVLTLYPAPLSFARNDPSLGLAHGSFILVRTDVYSRLGGHELVKHELFEDTRLAQSWRAHGERSLCLDGQDVLEVQMYKSLSEILKGFRKNFFPAFRNEAFFWTFNLMHFSLFLLPFMLVAIPSTNRLARVVFILTSVTVLAIRVSLALRFRHPLWATLFQPLSEIILLAIAVASWWSCKFGGGVEWKGRRYHTQLET